MIVRNEYSDKMEKKRKWKQKRNKIMKKENERLVENNKFMWHYNSTKNYKQDQEHK